MDRKDYFSPQELYLLIEPFQLSSLFGLRQKDHYQMQQAAQKEAFEALQEKELIVAGKLSHAAVALMHLLKRYASTSSYLRLNHLFLTEDIEETNQILGLAELKKDKAYQVYSYDKLLEIPHLLDVFPLLSREPASGELDFLTKEIPKDQLKSLKQEGFPDNLLHFEYVRVNKENPGLEKVASYQNYLFFEDENRLIYLDLIAGQYVQCSQYYLLKMLFDALSLPYKREDMPC